jgi:hypothetical protein
LQRNNKQLTCKPILTLNFLRLSQQREGAANTTEKANLPCPKLTRFFARSSECNKIAPEFNCCKRKKGRGNRALSNWLF